MELKEIIRILMLSELYFSLPLGERKEVVWRLWSQYGHETLLAPSALTQNQPLAPPGDDRD